MADYFVFILIICAMGFIFHYIMVQVHGRYWNKFLTYIRSRDGKESGR